MLIVTATSIGLRRFRNSKDEEDPEHDAQPEVDHRGAPGRHRRALAALTFAPEASAHTLSTKEARTHIKLLVKRKARYGYEPRSMILYCGRRTAHSVHCDILYNDLYGDQWCGTGTCVYLRGSFIYTRMNVSARGCESF